MFNDMDDYLLPGMYEEIKNLRAKIKELEGLKPMWANSVSAQVTTVALTQLWRILGVNNQTDAVLKLQELMNGRA